LPEKWTGDVVAKMHVNRISYETLAEKLGFTKSYVSMVLNGSRRPPGAEKKFSAALDEILKERRQSHANQVDRS